MNINAINMIEILSHVTNSDCYVYRVRTLYDYLFFMFTIFLYLDDLHSRVGVNHNNHAGAISSNNDVTPQLIFCVISAPISKYFPANQNVAAFR